MTFIIDLFMIYLIKDFKFLLSLKKQEATWGPTNTSDKVDHISPQPK